MDYEIKPYVDLREVDLSCKNLSGADLSCKNLCRANLSEADLRGANLHRADLRGANLSGANLNGASLNGADLCGADLCGADLCGANLCGASLWNANLWGASLCGASLRRADLRRADLRGANLCGARLHSTNLSRADLRGVDLTGTCLDPMAAPNAQVGAFDTIDQGQWCVGYRTKNSPYYGNSTYDIGDYREAPIFSTSYTACHPGIFVLPKIDQALNWGSEIVQVIFRPWECHRAGDKWRVKWLIVWDDVEITRQETDNGYTYGH